MEKIRIKKLEIEQIGPFGSLVLEFPEKPESAAGKAEVHILTGENGTGKSTVLEMLSHFLGSKIYNAKSFSTISKARDLEKSGFKIFIEENDVAHFRASGAINWSGGGPIGKLYDDYLSFIRAEKPFYIAAFAYSGYFGKEQNEAILGIKELENLPFENACDFRMSIKIEHSLQWLINTKAAEAIAKSQNEEVEAADRREAVAQLEKAISKIIGKPIHIRLQTKPFKVVFEVDNEKLDFNQLPDGLKSIVSWLADLLMRMDRVKWVDDLPVLERPFILFLDEIEVHMHPAWQRKILPAVQGLFPNAQIFISTHSPFVVGSVDGAWIHKLVKPNGDSKLAAGFPMLSKDEESYEYWLEEVFGIYEQYGPEAQIAFERRKTLLKKDGLSETEKAELSDLDLRFGFSVEGSPLGQRVLEQLKRLKNEQLVH